jgi:hypothetical protein
MRFYVGMHQPGHTKHIARAFVSINRVRNRKSPVPAQEWIMDSGAFTELSTHGCYRHAVDQYAADVNRIAALNPTLIAVVAQDWMCEPVIIAKTGLSVGEHQRLTIERYDDLLRFVRDVNVMPVLQGFRVSDYLDHIDLYGARLGRNMWVGVGSICKRNGSPAQIEAVLTAIKIKRPDLRLHGFGVKTTSLCRGLVRECLYSADSMSWSWAARRQGRNQNCWREALAFAQKIESMPVQGWMFDA